ncbi:MAG: hypothetical protein ACOC6G_00880 [Thermoproteota archaeon]
MKKELLILGLIPLLLLAGTAVAYAKGPAGKSQGGFDQYGYNYQARLFNGLLGDADRDDDPTTYHGLEEDDWSFTAVDGEVHEVFFDVEGTKLVMKWSEAWHMAVFGPDGVRKNGDELSWEQAEAQYGEAWCTNHDQGSGEIDGETYEKMRGYTRIVYVGDTTGYTNPIWGSFAVVHKVVNAKGICLVFHEPNY